LVELSVLNIKRTLLLAALLLAGCAAHQPPLQMMAEARSAIQAAHDRMPVAASAASAKLALADRSLRDASNALDHQQYDQAKAKAKQARNLARAAIRLLPQRKNPH